MTTEITMTEAAQQHIRQYLAANPESIGLRLATETAGCSGHKYVFSYAQTFAADDHVFPIAEDITVYVPADSFDLVKGTRIDYITRGLNGFLRCLNPNETATCGCGESFSTQ